MKSKKPYWADKLHFIIKDSTGEEKHTIMEVRIVALIFDIIEDTKFRGYEIIENKLIIERMKKLKNEM